MVRIASAFIAILILAPSLPAQAGNMHQSPLLRHDRKRMCPNGKPMTAVRMGRSRVYGCS